MSEEGGRTSQPRVALAVAVGLVAFLMVTAWSQVRGQSETAERRRRELASLVETRQRQAGDLETELAALRKRFEDQSRTNARAGLRALEGERLRFALAAGTTPARGPGIVVALADSADADRADPGSADLHIQDVDVQLVVNALWEAGAEAVAINGQRVVGTTAIRSAGGAILVNYKVLTSPYRIEAVGDARGLERLFRASAIARRFTEWSEVYHLGYTVRRSSRLTLPAFGGSIRLRYAQPSS